MMWRRDEIVTFVPSSWKIITFLEVLKKTFSKPWSVTSNLESEVLWRKCDVTSFRHHPPLKPRFVPSRTQKNDVTMWRNRHICTKFQENRYIFGSTKKNFFETWQRHIEPRMLRFVSFRHVPHSNPGQGSGKISARNDPQVDRKRRCGNGGFPHLDLNPKYFLYPQLHLQYARVYTEFFLDKWKKKGCWEIEKQIVLSRTGQAKPKS